MPFPTAESSERTLSRILDLRPSPVPAFHFDENGGAFERGPYFVREELLTFSDSESQRYAGVKLSLCRRTWSAFMEVSKAVISLCHS